MRPAQVVTEEPGFLGRRLLTRPGRGGLEIYVLDLAVGAARHAEAHSPGVIEHVIVLAGEAEVGPAGDVQGLTPGDCMSFSADRPHVYRAASGPARLLLLTDYP